MQRRFVRLTALAVVAAVPFAGMSAPASAKATAKVCAKHPARAKCAKSGGGSASGGTGGSSPQITVQIDPQPLVETGQSEVHAVVQVEALPSFAGDAVNIDSSQLEASCQQVDVETMQMAGGGPQTVPPSVFVLPNRADAVLDDDGNATVIVDGFDCAPGSDVIEADLEVAPFLTALTTLTVSPPVVTPEGLTVYPRFGGLNQEVETGDTSTSGDSDIYAVFYVETNPVYAEQTVEIGSAQLEGRCVEGWLWSAQNQTNVLAVNATETGQGVNTGPKAQTILDDDGNAVFIFEGASCASGPSQVIADVLAGTHPTYVTEFTVLPPAPTI